MSLTALRKHCQAFVAEEDGAGTILALYFTLMFLVVGGLAIDFNKTQTDLTQLQVATDSAAHAALYSREKMSSDDAKAVAVQVAESFMENVRFGSPITAEDITFGTWDKEAHVFTASLNSRSAVKVVSHMNEARENPSNNLLLKIIGQDSFNLSRTSVYSTYRPPCFMEGFVADDVVDIQSNNSFGSGFCIHSNTYVSLNSNNTFEPGSVVSMPNLDDLDIPKSGFETNNGLEGALRTGTYRLRILNMMDEIIEALRVGDDEWLPSFMVAPLFDSFTATKVVPEDFTPNSITTVSCGNNGTLTMDPGTYANLVIITGCKVKFGQGAALEDVWMVSTNLDVKAFNAPSGLRLGADDSCAEGGGAVLITKGGFNAAADLQMYGSQILALKDIEFAANAEGIEGASMVSYATISGTSNMDMGFCNGNGQEENLQADYFRMVE